MIPLSLVYIRRQTAAVQCKQGFCCSVLFRSIGADLLRMTWWLAHSQCASVSQGKLDSLKDVLRWLKMPRWIMRNQRP
jgi:hypothetical protein